MRDTHGFMTALINVLFALLWPELTQNGLVMLHVLWSCLCNHIHILALNYFQFKMWVRG